jgi:hypothetical protein
MIAGHLDHQATVRPALAAVMACAGVAGLIWPQCFAGVVRGYTRWATGLTAAEKERVRDVVCARERAEGISGADGRAAGVAIIAIAGLELLPFVPLVLPYALICLVLASAALRAYLQFRRATDQRVAPLLRRSPFTALPALLIVALLCALFVASLFALYPPARLGAIVTAVAMLVLAGVAWRIANAPALLFGADPQWEYAVDERLRIGRARNAALLACAVGYVFVALAQPTLSPPYEAPGEVAYYVSLAAFIGAMVAYFLPLRARLRVV